MRRLRLLALACLLSGALAPTSPAAVSLPRVLGSGMVLQRDMPVPIWGTADAGEKVKVTFRGQSKSITAGVDGRWEVHLDPLKVGPAATLTVAGRNTIVLEDVLVGEVWFGSGQSNLDTFVPDYVANDPPLAEAAKKSYPTIRLLHSTLGDGWQQADPQSLRQFSAQLFYFGLILQRDLDVPIGLIQGAVRGSASSSWVTEGAINGDPAIQKLIAADRKANPPEQLQKKHDAAMEKWRAEVAAAKEKGVAGDKLPKQPWRRPSTGETRGKLGDYYDVHVRPIQPFAVRGVLWDQGEGGTNIEGVPQNLVMAALIRTWRADWRQGDFPWLYVQKPSGGGPALNPADPVHLGSDAFQPLPKSVPQNVWDADKRTEYTRIESENAATFMIPASDLAPGVHPANKSGYGTRGGRVALGAVYAIPVAWHGPKLRRVEPQGASLRLVFDVGAKALAVPAGQPLQGFAIAGADKKFHWADAVIEGDAVVLTSPKVATPVMARYGWWWTVPWANLFNSEGLPAATFRTDR